MYLSLCAPFCLQFVALLHVLIFQPFFPCRSFYDFWTCFSFFFIGLRFFACSLLWIVCLSWIYYWFWLSVATYGFLMIIATDCWWSKRILVYRELSYIEIAKKKKKKNSLQHHNESVLELQLMNAHNILITSGIQVNLIRTYSIFFIQTCSFRALISALKGLLKVLLEQNKRTCQTQ